MIAKVRAKYLGINTFMNKEKETFRQLHAYDGSARLLTPFINESEIDKIVGCEFGDELELDLEIYSTQKGLGMKVLDIKIV